MTSSQSSPSLLESLGKHDVDGSKNVICKCNFAFLQSFFNYSAITLEKYVLTILELNWNPWDVASQNCHHMLKHLSSYAHVVHTTAKQVISRRRKNENVFKMSKDEKCTCKACKNTVFRCQTCKFVGVLLPSSSWLLKLPSV